MVTVAAVSRYFVEVAYHGGGYHGWQVQPNALSVQQVLNEKLSTLLREPIEVVGSGRTDAGVHCQQQFAHFDTQTPLSPQNLKHRLNAFLPSDIAIGSIVPVKPDAHARFHAVNRRYEYLVTPNKSPFLTGLAYFLPKSLHLPSMNQAAALLPHHRDYQAFCKTHTDNKTFICEVTAAHWDNRGDLLVFNISANRFLRGMVRLLTGALLQVGMGQMSVADFERMILQKQQQGDRKTAPAHGLYLAEVRYPSSVFIG